MSQHILIIMGHPDPGGGRFCHALAQAYAEGARQGGHEVRLVDVAQLDFPLLRTQDAWQKGALPAGLAQAQQDIAWAQHLVMIFPLWLGGMPALLKGFLEQVARPGFAIGEADKLHPMGRKLLVGRSARLVVTMGMPAMLYRYFFRAHSLKALERNILGFVGIAPVRETLIGLVANQDRAAADGWLAKLRQLGRRAG